MTDAEFPSLEALADRYYAADDKNRKGWTYFKSYARLLENRRGDTLRVLELGVASGASLLSWRDYLPRATVVGIDIIDPPKRVLGQERVHVLQGSQDDPALLDRAAAVAGGPFDLIIDDASHIGYLTKRSLHYLFLRWLVPGGWYVIEDFGTGYLGAYPDGRDFAAPDCNDAVPGATEFRSSQNGMVGVVKQLVDLLMQELMTGVRSHLSIERLIIETNIVFIEKSTQPGGPVPDAGQASAAASEPAADRLGTLAAAVEGHAERIHRLEVLVDRLQRT
jgi:hypothetical protein